MTAVDDMMVNLERVVRRMEARNAREIGIDTTRPGWGDEYAAVMSLWREQQDELIATPHVADAIAGMEEQFTPVEGRRDAYAAALADLVGVARRREAVEEGGAS